MKRQTTTAVYSCTNPSCRNTLPNPMLAPRVMHPDLAGTGVRVCSHECGTAWLDQYTPAPKSPEEQETERRKVQPEPNTEGKCGCACGGTPKGGRFLPGHDARLKARRRNSG